MCLHSPKQLKEIFPLSREDAVFISQTREALQRLCFDHSKKQVLIVGPCSVHDPESTLEYANLLKQLSSKLNNFTLIMRVFLEKPRTHKGWKGLAYDPHLDESHNLLEGLKISRKLLCKLTELQMPIATEFVDPLIAPYFEDLISWGMIGARTSASQPHRQLTSLFPFPVGFKNSIHGELDPAIFGILSANLSHTHFGIDENGQICAKKTEGNPYAHLVLRGSEANVNFDPDSVQLAMQSLRSKEIQTRILIDCSHGNSQKEPELQKKAFISVIQQIQNGNFQIGGAMLESHLFPGNQSHQKKQLDYGISITDACLGWEETESLILWADEELSMSINSVHN